ncbi:hypothetical protein ACO2SS_15465, partial [Enterovirga sp. CN4-39]
MSSSTSPVSIVLTVTAVVSAGVLLTAGIAHFGGGTPQPGGATAGSSGCDDRIFPYVQRDCPKPNLAQATAAVAPARAQPPAAPSPAEVTVAETGSATRNQEPAASPPPVLARAERMPEAQAPDEPAEGARPRKPFEPITVTRAEKPPVERSEPPARNVRVIPIDRTHLAKVPPADPAQATSGEPSESAQPAITAVLGRSTPAAPPPAMEGSRPSAPVEPAKMASGTARRSLPDRDRNEAAVQAAGQAAKPAAPGEVAASTLLAAQHVAPVAPPAAASPAAPTTLSPAPTPLAELKPAEPVPHGATPVLDGAAPAAIAAAAGTTLGPAGSPTAAGLSPNENRDRVTVTSLQGTAPTPGPVTITVPDGAAPGAAPSQPGQAAAERKLTPREQREAARIEGEEKRKAELAARDAERTRLAAEAQK